MNNMHTLVEILKKISHMSFKYNFITLKIKIISARVLYGKKKIYLVFSYICKIRKKILFEHNLLEFTRMFTYLNYFM